MKKIQKDNLVKIISIVLAVLAVIAVIALVAHLAGNANDDYKKVRASYSVGMLDKATGRPVGDAEYALYTKDLIECTGVELYADFDSNINYTVHFYDENENWISCMDNEGLNMKIDEMPEEAVGIRIVITPLDDENNKISWFEKGTYAKQLTVKITTAVINPEA